MARGLIEQFIDWSEYIIYLTRRETMKKGILLHKAEDDVGVTAWI